MIESGHGAGVAIVREWTPEDHARLLEAERDGHRRGLGGSDAYLEALRRLARAGHHGRIVGVGYNAFMRATGNKHLWERLTGIASPTLFDNTNARLGVGDSTAAVTVTQTDLQAASNKLRKAMVAAFPAIQASPNDNKVDFRSDFVSGEAEFAWNEFALFNAAAAGSMFNRGLFSPSPGTKGAGVTWTLTLTLTNT